MQEHRDPDAAEPARDDRDQRDNELGYRNVDEESEHDERGSQGPGRGEPPSDETDSR